MNNSEPIEIIKFFLKIYDLRDSPTYEWVYGLVCGFLGKLLGGVLSNH